MSRLGPPRVVALTAWDEPVTSVRHVDAARADAFDRLGIYTVEDLLRHYPYRYLDLSSVSTLADARLGQDITVVGRVHDIKVKRPRPRLSIVEIAIVDGTGVLIGVWFNQPFMANRFVIGERVAFAGKVEMDFGLKQIKNPFVEKLGADDSTEMLGRVLPVHRATEGLTTNWIRRLVANAVEDFAAVPDFLPAEVRVRHGLRSLSAALRAIHFPETSSDIAEARQRLVFEEFFILQIGMAMRRHVATIDTPGVPHVIDGPKRRLLSDDMPFILTDDQTRAVQEILEDMARPEPMNRMLLGDVGTGKTAVAAHALCAAVDSGKQAAMMAPTEVLASQYAGKLGPMLDGIGVRWMLLTGSLGAKVRREALAAVESGDASVVFGTHALIEKDVAFKNLSLAIVDEQHRFGVSQRLGLRSKGASADMLVMTATPIPRSLALTLYGDLETSYLRQRPNDQTPRVTTEIVRKTQRKAAYESVRTAVKAGRQAYVVCALVDQSDVTEAKAAVDEAQRLEREVFPDLKVGLLTGRMKGAEKVAVMDAFRAGEIDVLVSTTVIEVGVDVPNATVMIVENAERFGLAQLHQLRGRIGRGEHPGTCLLFADARTTESRRRMDAIVSTQDGFVLAEYDLTLRGEGELLGERQHGLPTLKIASLIADSGVLDAARSEARALIAADPVLGLPTHQPLHDEVKKRFGAAWEWVSAG